ncbi:flagellar assembly protein FliH [Marinospirillum perlucidum]|uniref:flagellar assembly protein FliH n=1 Tax=Marinospirillum perlucidum TaxID=1982602 RepID=UPI000DF25353|nr:flagellar assembly protein FliH [Marinospirillum perlucidum]
MPHRKRIPANEKVPYERWEMPDLTGVRKRIAQRLDELEEEQKSAEEAEPPEPQPPTPEELEALREEARQEGYQAGFDEGRQQGYEEGRALGYQEGEGQGQEAGFQAGYQQGLDQSQQEVDQQLGRLQGLIEQFQGPLEHLDQEVEAGLLSLVDLISRALLRREVSLDRSFLSEVIQEAVAALPQGHQRLRIYINPEDQQLAEAATQNLLEDYRLLTDPAITPGGVKVETLQSLVDSTLENRYKKVIDSLLDAGYKEVDEDLAPLSRDVLAEPPAAPPKAEAEEPVASRHPEEPSQENSPETAPEEEASTAINPDDYRHQGQGNFASAANPDSLQESQPAQEEAPASEGVARVSLQRNAAPEHLPPLNEQQAAPAPDSTEVPEASLQNSEQPEDIYSEQALPEQSEAEEEPLSDQEDEQAAFASDPLAELTDTTSSSEPQPQMQEPQAATQPEETVSASTPSQVPDPDESAETAAAPQTEAETSPPLTDEEEDDFFDQALGGLEAEVPESASTEPAQDDLEDETTSVAEPGEASEVEKEKVWAPESVHEVRYLEDPEAVMESTWMDDLNEDVSDDQESGTLADSSDSTTDDDLLDELLNLDEDAADNSEQPDSPAPDANAAEDDQHG